MMVAGIFALLFMGALYGLCYLENLLAPRSCSLHFILPDKKVVVLNNYLLLFILRRFSREMVLFRSTQLHEFMEKFHKFIEVFHYQQINNML